MRHRKEKGAAKAPKTRRQKIKDVCYYIIMFSLIGIMAVSGWHVYNSVHQYSKARRTYKQIEKVANVDPDQFTGVVDFDKLRKINDDVCAWLYQEDTVIDYPVVQGTDNSTYLHHDLHGNYSVSGTLFVDYRDEPDFKGFNTVIYGHHMNDGSMFKSLRGYTKVDGYYNKHKTLELITPEKKYHLVVFSSFITKADSDAYNYSFPTEQSKQDFIDFARSNSAIDTNVDVTTSDRIVTLSTCAYDFENARYVVFCKMVPWTDNEVAKGEALQKKIDAQEKNS
jgi:sortase B